jgi:hypothetical protein
MSLAIVGQPYIDYGPDPVVQPNFVLTVTPPICQTRDQELAYFEYAAFAAARNVRAAGGQVTSGTISAPIGTGQASVVPQIVLGTYVYNPIAPK